MANPVRPWLKKFLAAEIREAISCKKEKLDDPDAAQQADLQRFSDDGSTYRNEVVAADSAWPEAYVQARQVGIKAQGFELVDIIQVLSVKPLQMLLGDGQHTVIATFDGKTIIPYEEDIDEEIKVGRKGDILRLDMYTLVTTTHGPKDERVRLHVKMLHYVHTQPKLMGAPVALCDDREITGLLDRVARLQRSSLVSEAYTDSRQGSVVAPSPGHPSIPSAHQSPASIKDTTTMASQVMVTQVGTIFQTQAVTPVPQNPRKSTKLRLEDDGLEIQTGDNLAEPRTAGLPKFIKPAQPSLLSIIEKRPQTTVVSKPDSTRPSHHSPVKEVRTTPSTTPRRGTTSAVEAVAKESTATKPEGDVTLSSHSLRQEDISSKLHVNARTVKPAASRSHVPEIDEMASYSAGRAARGRHDRIPPSQLALLGKKNCWPRSPTAHYTPYNVPEAVLAGWNKAAKAVLTAASSSSVESSEASDMDVDEPATAAPMTAPQAPSPAGRESELNSSPEFSPELIESKQRRENLPPESSQVAGEVSPPPWKTRKPAEAPLDYRDRRRQFMKSNQRLYWLKKTYGGDNAPAFSALEASEKYTEKYPDDVTTADDMKALYTTDILLGWQTNKNDRQHTPMAMSEHDEATASEHESIDWEATPRQSQNRIQSLSRGDVTVPTAPQVMHPPHDDYAGRPSLSQHCPTECQASQATGDAMEIELDDQHAAHNGNNECDQQSEPEMQAVAEETSFVEEVLIKHSGEGAQEEEDLYVTSQTPPRVPATILKTTRHSTEISQHRVTPPAFETGAVVTAATVQTKQQRWAKSWLRLPCEEKKRLKGKHRRDTNNHVLLWKLP